MSHRESILAAAVGLLLVVVVGVYVYSRVGDAFRAKRLQVASLTSTINDKKLQVQQGIEAGERLTEYRRKSLPDDAELARSRYKAWLLDLVEKQTQLADPVVSPGSITPVKGVYRRLSFTVSGQGRLEQLTKLLYEFYSVDYLHQVRAMRVKPIPGTKLLDISLTIEALSLIGASTAEKLSFPESSRLKHDELADYLATIVERNLFGPANRPPQLSRIGDQQMQTDRSLSLTVNATDPDPLDKVTFALENAPAGASISATGGQLQFRTQKTGTYELVVVARDDGVPRRESRETIEIMVVEPPPEVVRREAPPPQERPRFDDAKFAYVTAITEVGGQRELWLSVRDTGKLLKLSEGDRFEVERLQAHISRLGVTEVDVTSGDETRRFRLGENLSQGKVVPGAEASVNE